MKLRSFAIAMAFFLAAPLFAQEGTVEKSVISIQAGPIGFWGNYEARLGNKWALRAEGGFDLWFYNTYFDGKGNFLAPSVSIEPRWYYNIEKRHNKGKNTQKNSANFVTVAVEYFPDAFVIGGKPSYISVPNQISVIPKWGMRRMIGSHFNYELGAGLGFVSYLSDKDNLKSPPDAALDLHIRLGYTF